MQDDMIIDGVEIVTYTHSSCKDVWCIYFGQLDEYLKGTKSTVICNESCSDYQGHFFRDFPETKPYWEQWVDTLEQSVSEDLILYMQEDFFLYKKPDEEFINKLVVFLRANPKISFVKLIANNLSPRVARIYDSTFLIVPSDPYFFSMQPTLWRKKDFINLHRLVKSSDFVENKKYNDAALSMNLLGSFVYRGEPLRGKAHYDSKTFPYVATGLLRRKWNTMEYLKELDILTEKYGVDMNIRGHYVDGEKLAW